jgi:DNA-binding MarR family transcriptional regulator
MARSAPTREIDYRALADLRYHIRRFLRVREVAARAAGLEPQQHLCLLQVKGLEGRGSATIGALAERLQIRQHAVVQLVNRLASRGMVKRNRNSGDRRAVVVELRPAGNAVLERLAVQSLAELKTEGPTLVSALRRLVMKPTRDGGPRRPAQPEPRPRSRAQGAPAREGH